MASDSSVYDPNLDNSRWLDALGSSCLSNDSRYCMQLAKTPKLWDDTRRVPAWCGHDVPESLLEAFLTSETKWARGIALRFSSISPPLRSDRQVDIQQYAMSTMLAANDARALRAICLQSSESIW